MAVEKNIRLEPHKSRDLLVSKKSNKKRSKYQPPGRDYGGPPSRSSQPDTRGRDDPAPSAPTRDRHPPTPSIMRRVEWISKFISFSKFSNSLQHTSPFLFGPISCCHEPTCNFSWNSSKKT